MLIQAIDSYLEARPPDDRAKNCFHPSSLHKTAEELHRLYHQGDNSEPFEPRIKRVFDNGHKVHSRLLFYLAEAGILKDEDVLVHDADLEIHGHIDGLIELGGQQGILEIKSINANGFDFLMGPKPEHIYQLNAYMHCLKIPRGALLYECKNSQKLKEFYVGPDEAILEDIIRKIRTVQQWNREGGITA